MRPIAQQVPRRRVVGGAKDDVQIRLVHSHPFALHKQLRSTQLPLTSACCACRSRPVCRAWGGLAAERVRIRKHDFSVADLDNIDDVPGPPRHGLVNRSAIHVALRH